MSNNMYQTTVSTKVSRNKANTSALTPSGTEAGGGQPARAALSVRKWQARRGGQSYEEFTRLAETRKVIQILLR